VSKSPRETKTKLASETAIIPPRREMMPVGGGEVVLSRRDLVETRRYADASTELTAVSRYTPLARVNHWITAGSLILLALSGLSLFHPSLFFLSALFGGGENVRAVHPWIGIVLAVSFLGLFIRFFRLNLWEKNDNIWLGRMRSVLAGREDDLPELGKYNAGQKLVFWLQSILIIVLLISGFGLWEIYFGNSFTIDQKRLSVLVHAVAAVAVILVWIVHVYAAIWVKGTVRGMTRGDVSGGWAWRHHRKWLREEVAKEHKPHPAGE
jgi:formate dehydrogenase subunit gamma